MPAYPRIPLLALAISLLILQSGCDRKRLPEGAVARVGNVLITADELNRYLLTNGGAPAQQLSPEAASALLDQFIEEIAIVDQPTAGESSDPVATVPDAETRAGAIAALAATISPPDETAVEQFFRSHQEDFATSERRRVRQILVRDESLANQILKDMRSGVSFEDAARRYSRAPNAPRGGEVGWVERQQLPRLFEETIFSLGRGQVSGVVQTDASFFHIFKVDEIAPAGEPSLTQVRPIIVERLKEQAVRDRIQARLVELNQQGMIRIEHERLPFRYVGRWGEVE